MPEISAWEIILRLLLSTVLAGFVGLERESHGRPAGLRTHILVSLGSCLMMIISIYGFPGAARDPFRLAAQVVSGIGFLGAGTILREGLTIKGLTTAASLWVVSGIGLAIGCGLYFPGLVGIIFAVLTLISLEIIEKKLFNSKSISLTIVLDAQTSTDLIKFCAKLGVSIKHLELEFFPDQQKHVYEMLIDPNHLSRDQVLTEFTKVDGVKNLVWK
ncbi:MAG TPA: MgtC/SapB family protein [Bacillota bacterium]|nr:MgtC/SapB family protein [Bacillota bacterium]